MVSLLEIFRRVSYGVCFLKIILASRHTHWTVLHYYSDPSYWCSPSVLYVWSMSGLEKMAVKCRNATSCALERYNRAVNDRFPNRHPSLSEFATGIEKEAAEWVQFIRDSTTPSISMIEYPTASVKPLPNGYNKYQRKNDKTASPRRAFNKKRAAAHKKAEVARYIGDLD